MKFGKTLISHQIPQWLVYYINYKKLKKLIKPIDRVTDYDKIENNQLSQVPDLINDTLSNFYVNLNEGIEVVDQFFNTKFFEYNKRLARVVELLNYKETPGGSIISFEVIDNQLELNEILTNLVELKNKVHNLKWFGNLNNKAIIKILKKLDKKLSVLINLDIDTEISLQNSNKQLYITKKFNELAFANQQNLDKLLELINNVIQLLGNQEIPSNIDLSVIDKIQQNDGTSLTVDLFNGCTQKLILTYLLNAVISNAPQSIDFIFKYLCDNFPELPLLNKLDLNNRTFFHKLMVYLGDIGEKEFPVVGPSNLSFDTVFPQFTKHSVEDTSHYSLNPKFLNALKGLNYFLSQIKDPKLRATLMAQDFYLKTCIHYTSQYGLKDFIRLLFHYIVDEWSIKLTSMDNLKFWNDKESLTPLHLSIISNNPVTTKFLIMYSNSVHQLGKCSKLLLLAVRLNCDTDIIKDLLYLGGIQINYTDAEHNYETALYIATKHNYVELVEYLLENDADTEVPESIFGWTPIFIASAEGYETIVKLLLQYDAKFSFTDDLGWLPIEHATLRGHLKIADLLRPENSDILLYDINIPQNNLNRMKASSSYKEDSSGNESPSALPGAMSTSSIDKLPETSKVALAEVYKQLKSNTNLPSISRSKSPNNRRKKLKPVKSFGHKYLNEGESVVLITLGTTDLRDTSEVIQLNKTNLMKSFNIELDIALSLSIMPVHQKTGELLAVSPVIIDLPLDEGHGVASDPITFKFKEGIKLEDIIVTFDLVPTYQIVNTTTVHSSNGASSPVLGRAVAMLRDCYTRIGRHMRSLNNKITLPIIESMSLKVLGTINFEYLFVEPFSHPLMKTDRSGTYWKKLVSTRVIGHRGLGKNEVNRQSLQLGENTVESFIAAASLGASYVEFDVQLTKDFVPVVYHDFTVAESGVDIPMHALTAEQFLHLSDNNLHQKKRITVDDTHIDIKQPLIKRVPSPTIFSESSSPIALTSDSLEEAGLDPNGNGTSPSKARGLSSYQSSPSFFSSTKESKEGNDEIDKEFRDQFNFRMKLTKTWKDKGFKGNARGFSIASNFVTLKELFRKLPQNVGFNIELKYPMLDEAQHEDMGEIAIDLNYYIDTILKVIYEENTSNRDILFSSFHPDICVLLLLKQPSMPILFLTEAGTEFMADIRASSLQNAIRFAKNWNLLGIVSAAGALVRTPRLTQVVKSSGLVCVTYGVENNDPELVKIQMRAGVDAVIADSVLAVRDGLRSDVLTLKGLEDSSGSEETTEKYT
ncbi:Glycerophosphocholine phosphodiesterase [Scheffersomyces spartinae]|uniref:Glycerophosphocholine phosphodiesterase n=1 Tax=Scheffersomyces spartinae TaxID=45513 RepID=A0A9P7VCF3_9ASCO|nr:Glycerophosphocholine phosphodiesterase [Scheffersomyces spartinae]KAG7195411.1 Glycerophosphocholine phosphodiesterase [Scheffersomyces spartinae]